MTRARPIYYAGQMTRGSVSLHYIEWVYEKSNDARRDHKFCRKCTNLRQLKWDWYLHVNWGANIHRSNWRINWSKYTKWNCEQSCFRKIASQQSYLICGSNDSLYFCLSFFFLLTASLFALPMQIRQTAIINSRIERLQLQFYSVAYRHALSSGVYDRVFQRSVPFTTVVTTLQLCWRGEVAKTNKKACSYSPVMKLVLT